ncbi:MAG: TRAP transporter small permease [Cyclobacteriaceae bacterium]
MRILSKTLEAGTLLSTVAFIGSILFQIYARLFLPSAPSWTEEASRLFFVYAMSFAAGLAVKDNEYVFLDLFYERMKPSVQKTIDVLVPGIVSLLFLIMGIFAIQYVQLGIPEKSPSIGISMAWIFGSVLVMSVTIAIYSIHEIIDKINEIK